MVRRHRPVEQRLDGGQKVVGNGAADAAVGELDDVLVGAVWIDAFGDQPAVEAEIAAQEIDIPTYIDEMQAIVSNRVCGQMSPKPVVIIVTSAQ